MPTILLVEDDPLNQTVIKDFSVTTNCPAS